MLDPLLFKLLALVFALLFLTAGVHKLGDRLRFRGILVAYQILPANLVGPSSLLIPLTEILLGVGWLFVQRVDLLAAASAALLTAYALVMAINLIRGRTYIDCGCSFSSRKASSENSGIQQLSPWLVYRNILLIMLSILAGTGMSERSIGVLDYFSLAAATVALVFVYGAFNQLLVNHNAIDSWRKPLRIETGSGGNHD